MIVQEYLKIVRRRGLFWTGMILTTVAVIAIVVVSLILHGSKPESYDGGKDLLSNTKDLIALVAVIFAILLGAQAGAWDFANGTFRYMAMTGRPRLQLYAARIPALIAAVVTILLPAGAIAVVAALVMPLGGSQSMMTLDASPAVDLHAIADFWWELILVVGTYSLLSLAIGALLRSSGPAIAVALVWNLIGLEILAGISSISETASNLMLPNLLERLAGGTDPNISIAAAAIALLVWLGTFLGAGAARTVRSEL